MLIKIDLDGSLRDQTVGFGCNQSSISHDLETNGKFAADILG
jgi:hypothetical protein